MINPPVSNLFGAYPRVNGSPPKVAESSYEFLDRAAGGRYSKIRDLLENWFTYFPENAKKDLRKRFIKRDEGSHLGAWWELYIYSLYRHLGYTIERDPTIVGASTTPDFLVTKGPEALYVECTVDATNEGPLTTSPAIEASIYDAIRDLPNSNFSVGIQITRVDADPPSTRKIAKAVADWVQTLNYSTVVADIGSAAGATDPPSLPHQQIKVGGWELTAYASPKPQSGSHNASNFLGALPASLELNAVDNAARLEETVSAKGAHYGRLGVLDKPLVVAVLSVSRIAAEHDMTNALFGWDLIPLDGHSEPAFERRVHNQHDLKGYWKGPESANGARVSGVIFSHDLQPTSVGSHLPSVWLNPWAHNKISSHPPFSTITADDDGVVLESRSAETPHSVFGPLP